MISYLKRAHDNDCVDLSCRRIHCAFDNDDDSDSAKEVYQALVSLIRS